MLRFIAVVADLGAVPTHVISKRSGLTMKDCSRISSRLVSRGRMSRLKPPLAEGGGHYRYYLTDAQRDHFYRLVGVPGLGGLHSVDVVDRMRFLRMLKERTVYRESPVLDAIIGDYERMLHQAVASENA